MAGYDGYSKSNNALEAEKNGSYPLSVATKIISKKAGITQKEARMLLTKLGSTEWHHTSKNYNRTDFYSTKTVLNMLSIQKFINIYNKNEKCIRDILIKNGRRDDSKLPLITQKYEIPTDLILCIYYKDFDWDCYDDEKLIEKYNKY